MEHNRKMKQMDLYIQEHLTIYIHNIYNNDHGVMVIITGNGDGVLSSNLV